MPVLLPVPRRTSPSIGSVPARQPEKATVKTESAQPGGARERQSHEGGGGWNDVQAQRKLPADTTSAPTAALDGGRQAETTDRVGLGLPHGQQVRHPHCPFA